ncbi:hypothetical protein RND81_05G008800 [Saponaria officinalis]|uniref:DUF7795 domain-containing protein n=1 Tax=Saponaria officinalis TaxID=3572 RepID=A0AAW1KQ46_SAPOF
MEQEVRSASNPNQEMKQILSEFLASVVKLEQLAEVGKRYLTSFQQGLEFFRRPSIHETSELVPSILKENETWRIKSYVKARCINAYDSKLSVHQTNISLSRLHDHLIEAKSILSELETLMNKAGNWLQATPVDPLDPKGLELSENSEHKSTFESKEIPLHNNVSLNAAECASFMAVIYSMVKQDYVMQERVVSSLGLTSSSEELDSYCFMWSLRPFVNDDIIHEAIRCMK